MSDPTAPALSALTSSCRAMVTSPHPLASAAGLAVLKEGGNAAEAAVAVAAMLSVTDPHFCGIGGDAVWMLGDATGRTACLLGIGQGVAAADRLDRIEVRGPGSVLTSACAVDSWGAALAHGERHWAGRMGLGRLLEPAIAAAEEGVPAGDGLAHWLAFRAGETPAWPGFGAVFGGIRPDARLHQPALARSLGRIARHGVREFYDGALARDIARGLAAAGAPLALADLAATATRLAEPLALRRGAMTLLAPPPPTQGVATLMIMGVLDRLGVGNLPPDSADAYHLCVEAVKQAFARRGQIADPLHAEVPAADWLASDALDAVAAAVDRERARPWPEPFRHADTVAFAVVDARGNAVSALQSLYYDWGSGVVAGDTGILWQNRGAAFTLEDGHPNRLRPGKLPFYTLNPGMALKAGRPHLLYGTQGADGQPQTLAVVLSGVLDHGLTVAEALARPRFLLGKTFSSAVDSLKIEADVGDDVLAELARRGHAVAPIPARSPLAGQAGLIRIDEGGTVTGGHDPRGHGAALGL